MALVTITEALAEAKTLGKRIVKKREFLQANICRHTRIVDPFIKDGGAEAVIAREMQSLSDLLQRQENIRVKIQESNQKANLTIVGRTKSVAGWLAWRKDCAPIEKAVANDLMVQIRNTRAQFKKQGVDEEKDPTYGTIVHTSEMDLSKKAEELETILGDLDGRLSLFNATTTIDV